MSGQFLDSYDVIGTAWDGGGQNISSNRLFQMSLISGCRQHQQSTNDETAFICSITRTVGLHECHLHKGRELDLSSPRLDPCSNYKAARRQRETSANSSGP